MPSLSLSRSTALIAPSPSVSMVSTASTMPSLSSSISEKSKIPSPSVSLPPHVPVCGSQFPDAHSALSSHGKPSSTRQPALQPSPPAVLPSSQPSLLSSVPLPHVLAGSHVIEPCSSQVPELHWLSSVHGSPLESLQSASQP